MKIAKVTGNVVSTKKEDSLVGMKLLIVEIVGGSENGKRYVAVDLVGAGNDEYVLIANGSSARYSDKTKDAPVDLAIVGIIDNYEEIS